MRKRTRHRIIVYLTQITAALPFANEFAQYREEEALKRSADSMAYLSVRMDNDPMANHQADLLERIEHAQTKQKL